ncbi:hypothetical protein BO85DRAFT_27934 [Aspergillus piperis CBS 112811]|uniref:Uncharacterized protein n=1 Tax=Aspergillus piperis CBS 112811 TaxID=1448313 RepID=A0A8G1RCG2_9EURO|nr:hypothetical protein BO85DRAFT_27934 [Aspergillus piperis CBS 112811]RAH63658.1 hypothetical protein BO85DRAFT_27934 [Aspergillus piperis CBS 112811]
MVKTTASLVVLRTNKHIPPSIYRNAHIQQCPKHAKGYMHRTFARVMHDQNSPRLRPSLVTICILLLSGSSFQVLPFLWLNFPSLSFVSTVLSAN